MYVVKSTLHMYVVKSTLYMYVGKVQYTQGHIVVDHLQRRTACHV